MKRLLTASILSGLLLVGLFAWNRPAFISHFQELSLGVTTSAPKNLSSGERGFDRFRLDGISFTSTDLEGRKRFSLKANRMEHRKRRLGPISLNPITEIVLNGAQFAFYSYPEDKLKQEAGWSIFPYPVGQAFQEMISQNGLGIVTRVLFTNMTVFLREPNKNKWTLRADTASLSLKNKNIHFNKRFSLTTSNGDQLKSNGAFWSEEKKRLQVKGPYLLTRREGITQGMNAFVSVNRQGNITTSPINTQKHQKPNQTLH